MSRVIMVTSGKGGVGKTTVASNLAILLSNAGHKTVIIDMDQGLRSTDVLLGLENQIVYNLFDALDGKCRLSQTLVKDKNRKGLSLLPASQRRSQDQIDGEAFAELIVELKKHFEFVILDSCSGVDVGFSLGTNVCEEALLIVTPDVLSVRAADRVKELLLKKKVRDLKVVINRVVPELMEKGEEMSLEDVRELLGLPVIGVIQDDVSVLSCVHRGVAVAETQGNAADALLRIQRRLLGEEVAIPQIKIENKFFSKFRNLLKGV